ncbi:hypothetical protein NL676_008257 [Syzygium grande]|nr:hypothetical protein NL676_008257 [Syzygium grande]
MLISPAITAEEEPCPKDAERGAAGIPPSTPEALWQRRSSGGYLTFWINLPKDRKSWAVAGGLHKLKKTVSALRSVVRDAEKRLLDDFMDQQFMVVQTPGGIREWFDDLKAAFYDAEDLLEEWSIEVTRRELPGKDEKLEQVITFFSPSNGLALGLKMTARVRRIRKRMEGIAAKGRDFDLREDVQVESGSRRRRRRERSDSFGYEEEIIGRDGAKSAILKFLLGSDAGEKIPVPSICGVGGVGKTALARCLYKDDMVNKHFDLRIWVCVRDLKMALQTITESATNEGVDDIELKQLQNRVVELVREEDISWLSTM